MVHENPTGEGDQPQRVFLQDLPWYSYSSTFFMADLSSSYVFHSCQELYLHILYHGWEPRFLQSSPLQLTSLRWVSRPTCPVFPLTLHCQPLWTCSQIMAGLTPTPCKV